MDQVVMRGGRRSDHNRINPRIRQDRIDSTLFEQISGNRMDADFVRRFQFGLEGFQAFRPARGHDKVPAAPRIFARERRAYASGCTRYEHSRCVRSAHVFLRRAP